MKKKVLSFITTIFISIYGLIMAVKNAIDIFSTFSIMNKFGMDEFSVNPFDFIMQSGYDILTSIFLVIMCVLYWIATLKAEEPIISEKIKKYSAEKKKAKIEKLKAEIEKQEKGE